MPPDLPQHPWYSAEWLGAQQDGGQRKGSRDGAGSPCGRQRRMFCPHGEEPGSSTTSITGQPAGRLPCCHAPPRPSSLLPPKHGPSDALPSTAIPPGWHRGPCEPLTLGEDPSRSFCRQLRCQVTKSPGMCAMPAFCLGNRSPDSFLKVFGGKQPWAASGQQRLFLTRDPWLLPSTLPAAEAASQHPETPSPFLSSPEAGSAPGPSPERRF